MSKTKIVIFYTVKVSRSTDRILQRVPMILAAILVSFESRDSIPPRNQSPKTFPLPKTQKINPHGYSEVASNDHSSPHHPSFHLSFQCGLYFNSTSYTRGQGQVFAYRSVKFSGGGLSWEGVSQGWGLGFPPPHLPFYPFYLPFLLFYSFNSNFSLLWGGGRRVARLALEIFQEVCVVKCFLGFVSGRPSGFLE